MNSEGREDFFLSPKEEFNYLLKSIEENSKHARTVMFALLVVCSYVLLTTFTSPLKEFNNQIVNLPIINVPISTQLFFFVSPLVILVIFFYLHIYIRELKSRLNSVNILLKDQEPFRTDPNYLLYPWIIVFAFQHAKMFRRITSNEGLKPEDLDTNIRIKPFQYEGILNFFVNFILWFIGPFVLLILWGQFINERDAVSLIPCFAFISAIYIASWIKIYPLKKVWQISIFLICLGLIALTIISVPSISTALHINEWWNIITQSWEGFKNLVIKGGQVLVIAFLILQVLPLIIWLISRPFGQYTLWIRLRFFNLYYDEGKDAEGLRFQLLFLNFISAGAIYFLNSNRRLLGISDNLSNINLNKAIFSGINLTGITIVNSNLKNSLFLEANFEESSLEKSNCNNSRIRRSQFSKANLTEVNLEGATIQASGLRKCHFQMSRFKGANIIGSSFDEANLQEADFHRANLDTVGFRRTNLQNAIFTEATISFCSFIGSDLQAASFQNSQIRSSFFENANLQGAQMQDVNMYRCDFFKARLQNAQFVNSNLKNSHFGIALLMGANFQNSYLNQAQFNSANLEGADFKGANLSGAIFSGTNLLEVKNLTIDQLSTVNSLHNAVLDPALEHQVKSKYPHLL